MDALDDAISAARKLSGQGEHAAESIKNTVGRLKSRRAKLFERLTAAVDEVATVYAGLLELSATARTMGVALDDTEVGAVNDSVTLLQMTFAELEADAANLPSEGLYTRSTRDDEFSHAARLNRHERHSEKNLDGYGTPPIGWERVRDTLPPRSRRRPIPADRTGTRRG